MTACSERPMRCLAVASLAGAAGVDALLTLCAASACVRRHGARRGLPSRRPPLAQTPVRFSLDWRWEGPAAPFAVALEKGYFKAEGLDVTIDPAAGSREPITRVASGAYDMGFGDMNSLIRFRDENPDRASRR